MPYTDAQRRLFHAAARDPGLAAQKGMSSRKAKSMADEADRLAREGKETKSKGIPSKRARKRK